MHKTNMSAIVSARIECDGFEFSGLVLRFKADETEAQNTKNNLTKYFFVVEGHVRMYMV